MEYNISCKKQMDKKGIISTCAVRFYNYTEGVNNFVSLDFFIGRFLPTIISRKPSIYKGLWALPTPGLWNKMEGQRHKIKNTTTIPQN